jgi:predicted PurR-regulated permease PerM
MLMAPVCRKLDNARFNRAISTTICLLLLIIVFAGSIWIVAAQIRSFTGDIPLIEEKANSILNSIHSYVEKRYDIPEEQQKQIIEQRTDKLGKSSGAYLSRFLGSMGSLFTGLAITLVVTFLLLFQKEKYETFFLKVTFGKTQEERSETLTSITNVAQQYLTGRAISMFILFVLYAIALFIIGVKNALLLAAIGALVNIIPYIGPFLAGVFPFLVALVTEESFQPAIWVAISFIFIQAIDNYFVTPFVLGGEVRLSALSIILSIICGGFVWGVAGMILFIPMLSIAKIIFDRIDSLKPYGFLIGDPGKSPSDKFREWMEKKSGKKIKKVL